MAVREMVNKALKELDADFNALYPDPGRDSNPPEKLLRAQLLMAFYMIRSEPQLVEQIDYKCCFAGWWASQWMTRSGITRYFPGTGTAPAGRGSHASLLRPGAGLAQELSTQG